MKSSSFQIIILAIFGFLVFVAVLIFSGVVPIGKKSTDTGIAGATLTIWGTLNADMLRSVFADLSQQNNITVTYIERSPESFDKDLAEALASGVGPDMLLAPQDILIKNRNKLIHIPYEKYQERTFRDTFVQGGEVYFLPDGILALPMLVDPLIFYYNRTTYENEGYQFAPKTWEEITNSVKKFTKKDEIGSLTESAIPFGSFNNLPHAKDILTMLLMQVGNPIYRVAGTSSAPYYQSALDRNTTLTPTPDSDAVTPEEAVITFFTQFADPAKESYTWNKSLVNARDAFTSESLAQYIGYTSELPTIAVKNPNLNFDVGMMPQVAGAKAKLTFAEIYGIALIKTSKNQVSALAVAELMTGPDFMASFMKAIAQKYPIAPARRDMLTTPPGTLYGPTLYNSAIIARAWYDPDSSQTYPIFAKLVTDVVRGTVGASEGISEASTSLSQIVAPN